MLHACPTCRRPLVVFELDGLEIDRCLDCGGTWLDRGEVDQIAERAGAVPGRLSKFLRHAGQGAASRRRCPRCGRRLLTISLGEAPALDIDRCPHGDGFWFDAGELENLVAHYGRAAGETAAESPDVAPPGEEHAVANFFSELLHHHLHVRKKGA